jgi:hypothetical protein
MYNDLTSKMMHLTMLKAFRPSSRGRWSFLAMFLTLQAHLPEFVKPAGDMGGPSYRCVEQSDQSCGVC